MSRTKHWVYIYIVVSDGYDMCQNNDSHVKEDLFSRKSDENNFIRAEDIDPSKKRLSHIAILLEKLVKMSQFYLQWRNLMIDKRNA